MARPQQVADAPGPLRAPLQPLLPLPALSAPAPAARAPDMGAWPMAQRPVPLMMYGPRPLAPLLPAAPLSPLRPDFSFASLLKPPWIFVLLATILAWNQTPLFSGF